MGLREEIEYMINDINSKRILWKQRASEAANRRFEATAKDVYREFGEFQRAKIANIFHEAIESFYAAYTPHVYKRTYSLYKLLEMSLDERGIVEYDSALDLVDREKMHLDRSGNNSLFDTVFLEGWHGGAKSISPQKESTWGEHPSTGTPYYRARGMVQYPDNPRPKMHRYGRWGRVAFRSKAPYEIFSEALDDAEENDLAQMFQEISQKNWDKLCENLQSDLTKIKREIYG